MLQESGTITSPSLAVVVDRRALWANFTCTGPAFFYLISRPHKIYETFQYARARMEPADRTWYNTERRVASISKRFFASHGLEKHVSQAVEKMCLNLPELFHITPFMFTVFVLFLATSHLFLTATRVWAWAAVKLPNFIVKLFSTMLVQKKKYVCMYMKRRRTMYT